MQMKVTGPNISGIADKTIVLLLYDVADLHIGQPGLEMGIVIKELPIGG